MKLTLTVLINIIHFDILHSYMGLVVTRLKCVLRELLQYGVSKRGIRDDIDK